MNAIAFTLTKAVVSGALIALISTLAKKDNLAASIVHSLPLMSLLAFIWLFVETRDTALIARHAQGTLWFVLPTLPLFLALPWMLRRGLAFWPALGIGIVLTIVLYLLTFRLLKAAGISL